MPKDHENQAGGANAPMGRRYSTAFCEWIKKHHFDKMPKGARSWALALNENIDAISVWRQTLPERERKGLVNAQSIVRRWQKTNSTPSKTDCSDDVSKAAAAWRRCYCLVGKVPPDQALSF
jgi:hypothetical protein